MLSLIITVFITLLSGCLFGETTNDTAAARHRWYALFNAGAVVGLIVGLVAGLITGNVLALAVGNALIGAVCLFGARTGKPESFVVAGHSAF